MCLERSCEIAHEALNELVILYQLDVMVSCVTDSSVYRLFRIVIKQHWETAVARKKIEFQNKKYTVIYDCERARRQTS